MQENKCLHTDGEFCPRCYPVKAIKTAVSFTVYLSKVNEQLYVTLDANTVDLKDFGIDHQTFDKLGHEIDMIMQENLIGKNK